MGDFMKRKLFYFLTVSIITAIFTTLTFAQDLRATAFQIQKDEDNYVFYAKLSITVNGQPKTIAEDAADAWLINGGREVVYTNRDGAGGYENEGQSLYIYEVKTGKTRKIMSQYYMILGVSEHKLKNGQNVLLVRMQDGGLGASYFSVVDPKRGEIFFQPFAEITSTYNDNFKLLFYNEEDWGTILEARGASDDENKDAFPTAKAKVKPNKTVSYDLNKLLKNKIIQRKHTMEILDAGLKNVKLYFWRANDDDGAKPFVLGTVERQVDLRAPLRPTLEELFRGTTKDEDEKGFSSSTFGMKFEGVVLQNGTATVKFSQPKGETNYGSAGPLIFLAAIERTAKQFPTIKKVEVCAIGETLIDAQLEEQFPRCK
jgi:hypothetical protein